MIFGIIYILFGLATAAAVLLFLEKENDSKSLKQDRATQAMIMFYSLAACALWPLVILTGLPFWATAKVFRIKT